MDRRKWLQGLGAMCASTITDPKEVNAKLTLYTKGFDDMPLAAFCDESLEAASRQFEFFPAYAALRKFLEQWWSEHKPAPVLLPGLDATDLDAEERVFVVRWIANTQGDWGKLKDGSPAPAGNLRNRLAIMRRVKPRAFNWLIANNEQAAQLHDAPKHEWDVTPDWIGKTLVTIERVHAARTPFDIASAESKLAMLRTAVEKYAPDLLDMVPERIFAPPERMRDEPSIRRQDDEAFASAEAQTDKLRQDIEKAAAAFEARTGRKPGQLSPEQLAAARAANPGVQKARAFAEAQAAGPQSQEAEDWVWTPKPRAA